MTDRGSPLPSTWIPRDLYQGPAQPAPGVLKLDGNEGNPPPRKLLEDLAAADLSKVRDYPDARPLESDIAERLGVDPSRVVVTAGADEALDRLFGKYGQVVVFVFRFLPAFRTMISLPAGLFRMGHIRFLLWTAGGALIWNIILAYAGFALGRHFQDIDRYLGPAATVCVIGAVIFYLWRLATWRPRG